MDLKPIYNKLLESYGYFEDHITELDNQADGKYYLLRAYDALVELQNIVDNAKVEITFAQDFSEAFQTNEYNSI